MQPSEFRKVTRAVIPVAGLGTRMLPATKAIPKEMLPVVDKPLIQYVIEEAAAGVVLLNERRSALISAAVTGKIDVRGWQPPASAPTPELVQEAV